MRWEKSENQKTSPGKLWKTHLSNLLGSPNIGKKNDRSDMIHIFSILMSDCQNNRLRRREEEKSERKITLDASSDHHKWKGAYDLGSRKVKKQDYEASSLVIIPLIDYQPKNDFSFWKLWPSPTGGDNLQPTDLSSVGFAEINSTIDTVTLTVSVPN